MTKSDDIFSIIHRIPRWITDDDIIAIKQICETLDTKSTIIEIGTFLGASAIAWSHYVCSESKIYTIDNLTIDKLKYDINLDSIYDLGFEFDDIFPQREKLLTNIMQYSNIEFIEARSPNLNWNIMANVIFIDAIHSDEQLLRDNVIFWYDFLKDDGKFVFHDYNKDWPIVIKVVDEFAAEFNLDLEVISNSVVVLHKNR